MKVLFNGELIEKEQVAISFEDRGYHFGDGLYEVVRIYKKKMFMFAEHFERLKSGAEKIRLPLPFSQAELEQQFRALIALNAIEEGEIYFQISRGIVAPREHKLPSNSATKPVYLAYILPFERPKVLQETGTTATIIKDRRWLHCDIKSLSLLGNILSLDEALQAGFDDALLERDGFITEASASNVWFVIDQVLYTHPDGELILPGITKKHLLDLARQHNLPVKEEAIKLSQLDSISECFLTNSVYEIVPVISIDNHPVADGKVGPLTKKLLDLYIASIK